MPLDVMKRIEGTVEKYRMLSPCDRVVVGGADRDHPAFLDRPRHARTTDHQHPRARCQPFGQHPRAGLGGGDDVGVGRMDPERAQVLSDHRRRPRRVVRHESGAQPVVLLTKADLCSQLEACLLL